MKFLKFFIFGLCITVIIWFSIAFLPYKEEIDKKINTNFQSLGSEVAQLHSLAVLSESKAGILRWASRQAYYEISYKNSTLSRISWYTNWALWYLSLNLLYSEKEIFYLWSYYSIFFEDWGINKAAIKFYGKPIIELPIEQQASIIAMVKSPQRYKFGSEKLENRVKIILSRYKES